MNKLLLLIFFLFTFSENHSVKPLWNTDFNEAINVARLENKKVLLYFSGSDWCKPCIQLKKYILESPEFIDFAEDKFVMLQVDFPRLKKNRLTTEQVSKNEILAERYNKRGIFPLLLVLDQDEKVVKTIEYNHQRCADFIQLFSGI